MAEKPWKGSLNMRLKRLIPTEPLPVKRTVKNQKILATSNRNVAGCFLWKADTVSQSLQ